MEPQPPQQLSPDSDSSEEEYGAQDMYECSECGHREHKDEAECCLDCKEYVCDDCFEGTYCKTCVQDHTYRCDSCKDNCVETEDSPIEYCKFCDEMVCGSCISPEPNTCINCLKQEKANKEQQEREQVQEPPSKKRKLMPAPPSPTY